MSLSRSDEVLSVNSDIPRHLRPVIQRNAPVDIFIGPGRPTQMPEKLIGGNQLTPEHLNFVQSLRKKLSEFGYSSGALDQILRTLIAASTNTQLTICDRLKDKRTYVKFQKSIPDSTMYGFEDKVKITEATIQRLTVFKFYPIEQGVMAVYLMFDLFEDGIPDILFNQIPHHFTDEASRRHFLKTFYSSPYGALAPMQRINSEYNYFYFDKNPEVTVPNEHGQEITYQVKDALQLFL